MAIVAKQFDREIVIDLTGPQGYAFCLMGYARDYGKQIGMEKADIDEMIKDMMSSDYEHLIQVFDAKFGDFVTLER